MPNLGDPEPGQGANRMVHAVEDEDIEVAQIARDGEIDNLAPAVVQRPIVAGPAFEDEKDRAWRFALPDEVATGANGAARQGADASEFGPVPVAQDGIFLEPARQGVRHVRDQSCGARLKALAGHPDLPRGAGPPSGL